MAGAKSLPLVALAGAATGVVLSLEARDSLIRFGAKSMLPAMIVFSIVKETGPVITGLVVSGRVGAGIGAEIGSMKVTEQIDAMEASAVDPMKYLVATRVLACMLMLPLTKHAIASLPGKQPAKEFSWEANKIFDKPDTAKLKKPKALDEAGKYMQSTQFGLTVVQASTDQKGDSEKDRTLAEARAMVVREHLVQNFKLDDTRVKTLGLGKSQDAGENGRVAVLIYPPGTTAGGTQTKPSRSQ